MRSTEHDPSLCACGCKTPLVQPRTGRRRQFVAGHRKRQWERTPRAKKRTQRWRARAKKGAK